GYASCRTGAAGKHRGVLGAGSAEADAADALGLRAGRRGFWHVDDLSPTGSGCDWRTVPAFDRLDVRRLGNVGRAWVCVRCHCGDEARHLDRSFDERVLLYARLDAAVLAWPCAAHGICGVAALAPGWAKCSARHADGERDVAGPR